jgi:protein TonB
MPAEFLRSSDPVRPAMRWWVLPASLAAHVSVAVAVIVIPLAADDALPPAPYFAARYVAAARVMPIDVPMPRASATAPRVSSPAPSSAPVGISREEPLPASASRDGVDPDALAGFNPGSPWRGLGSGVVGEPVAPPAPPEPPPDPPKRVRPGGDIKPPEKIVHVPPVYPDIARSGGVEGIVILEAVISERGTVEQVRVLRSKPLLDAAAIDAVRRWRYTPTLLNGQPVQVLMTITVHFSIDR